MFDRTLRKILWTHSLHLPTLSIKNVRRTGMSIDYLRSEHNLHILVLPIFRRWIGQ